MNPDANTANVVAKKNNTPTAQEIDWMRKIEESAHLVMKGEIELLAIGRVERNFTSNFAKEIEKRITGQGIRIDPFYNKHLDDSKRLEGRPIELDIAVHERRVDRQNLVAIELETTNTPKRDDVWKIEGLTQESGEFAYKLGLYVVFGINQNAGKIISMEWFKYGRLITK